MLAVYGSHTFQIPFIQQVTCALLLVVLGHAFGMAGQCEKYGKVYDGRVPESEQGFEHLTEPEDMVILCLASRCSLILINYVDFTW